MKKSNCKIHGCKGKIYKDGKCKECIKPVCDECRKRYTTKKGYNTCYDCRNKPKPLFITDP